MTRALEEGT